MNEIEIKRIFLEIGNHINPSIIWKKRTRENVMFFARTHIPIVSARKSVNFKIVVGIASFVLVLIITIPVTDTLASESRPGDVLYPVGRFFEKAKLALSTDNQKKTLIKEQLEKRVDEFEYVSKLEDSQYDNKSAQELVTHTRKVIDNERFTLEEKREIAKSVEDRLDQIESDSNKESVAKSIEDVKSILSQTEIKIDHKNADNGEDSDNQNTGVGGMNEEDSKRIPVELKEIEESVTSF